MLDETLPTKKDRTRVKSRYDPDTVLFAKIRTWDATKETITLPNPDNPYALLCVFRNKVRQGGNLAGQCQIARGAHPRDVEQKWLRFRYGDVEYDTNRRGRDSRNGKLKLAEMVSEPPPQINGEPVIIVKSHWRPPKNKPAD